MVSSRKATVLILVVIMVATSVLRFAGLGMTPDGLNPDEVSAGYEAYSLLERGTDRWGHAWPAYFISWGSGQNVLESYLSVPFINLFGLNSVSVRLVPALLGTLTVLLVFFITRKSLGRKAALVSAGLLAVMPWAVLSSRIAIESNILPFFLSLGIFGIMYGYSSKYARFLIPLTLLPFVLAMYAYAVALTIVPVLLIGIAWVYRRDIMRYKLSATTAVVLAAITAFPLGVFLVSNLVVHHVPHVFAGLPFNTQILLQSRIDQNMEATGGQTFWTNLTFFTNGLNDGLIWTTTTGYLPTLLMIFPLSFVGAYFIFRHRTKARMIIMIWFAASFTPVFTTPLNNTRANSLMIPMTVLAVAGGIYIVRQVRHVAFRRILTYGSLATLIFAGIGFYYNYFAGYNSQNAYVSYNQGIDDMIHRAKAVAASNEKIAVSESVNLNYMYYLFYEKADPADFSRHAVYYPAFERRVMMYHVVNYGRVYFDAEAPDLRRDASFVFITKTGDQLACHKKSYTYKTAHWQVGRCYV